MIEWYKITKELSSYPTIGQEVLVTTCFINDGKFDFDVITAYYNGDRDFDLNIEHGSIYSSDDCVIIAWAEKPAPYKFTV